MEKKGYDVFQKDVGGRLFMSKYYNDVISTRHFKDNISRGNVSKNGPKQQEFEYEIGKAWEAYLIDTGRATPTTKQLADKYSLATDVFAILTEMDDVNFKIIDAKKYRGAIKETDADFEVSIVKHQKPVVEQGKVIVANSLKDSVKGLAEQLETNYAVVQIKNNQITVEDENKNQTSVKITRKKQRLF